MDKGSSASWEQVHRILFPGGPVPASLINSNATALNSGAGILGPGPAATPPFINAPSTSSPAGPFVIQNSAHIPPPPPSHLVNKDRKDGGSHFGPPPPAPRDPKTLYYIKLFAAFVSKFGREYEAVVRTKQHGKPEFGFLFGAPPGSEAGLGNRYYEWQKDVLVKVSEAKKAVSEGNMPPDRLKSMQRELEKHMNGGQTLKDLRIESILGLPDHKLDWQKIAWEVGVALPGKRASQVETLDKEKMKTPTKADGEACVDPIRDWKQQNKADRPRRKDDHDSGEEFSPGGRRRRKRSRSPSPGRQRYRSRSPRSPRRSPAARSGSPSRRRGRSYSRSPPRRRTPPPPRRAPEWKRDGDERREEKQVQEPAESSPFPNKPHVLLHPRLQPMVPPQDHAGGFIAAENSFMLFPQASLQLQSLPDSGLVRVPPGFPQVGVGVAFPPALPDIPVQQQQFLLQQLQLSQLAAAQPVPLTNTWPSSDVQHVLVSPVPLPLFDQPAQQLQLQHQHQHQPQLQQLIVQPEKSPSNDVEMEVVSTSVKAEAPEVVVTSNGKATEDTSSSKSKEKDNREKDDETSRTNEKRALKIVRNTVADFVKELLNPKWRDGILSKDDFKVIAQKAVNKVVGNLQGSQIPKGPDRLDRFMSSSKEKITKLVQEYVEKHTKNAPVPVPAPATAPS